MTTKRKKESDGLEEEIETSETAPTDDAQNAEQPAGQEKQQGGLQGQQGYLQGANSQDEAAQKDAAASGYYADQAARYEKEENTVLAQIDRIEKKLDQLLEKMDGGPSKLDERSRKVPYIAPELPRGLSPNEILTHPMVTAQAANPTEPVNPMVSETEPAHVEGETEPAGVTE